MQAISSRSASVWICHFLLAATFASAQQATPNSNTKSPPAKPAQNKAPALKLPLQPAAPKATGAAATPARNSLTPASPAATPASGRSALLPAAQPAGNGGRAPLVPTPATQAAPANATTGRSPLVPPNAASPSSATSGTGRAPLLLPGASAAPATQPSSVGQTANATTGTANAAASNSAPCAPNGTAAASNSGAQTQKTNRWGSLLSKTGIGQQAQSTLGNLGSSVPAGLRPCGSSTPGSSTAPQQQATLANSSAGNRAALETNQGIGVFPGCCGYTLTAYSCLRNNSQVLCDFDVSNQGNTQANARGLFGDIRLVGSSGRVINRSDAYFVDSNGASFPVSQISSGNRIRLVMVFENVPADYSTVSLAEGQVVLPGVQLITPQQAGAPATVAAAQR